MLTKTLRVDKVNLWGLTAAAKEICECAGKGLVGMTRCDILHSGIVGACGVVVLGPAMLGHTPRLVDLRFSCAARHTTTLQHTPGRPGRSYALAGRAPLSCTPAGPIPRYATPAMDPPRTRLAPGRGLIVAG